VYNIFVPIVLNLTHFSHLVPQPVLALMPAFLFIFCFSFNAVSISVVMLAAFSLFLVYLSYQLQKDMG